MATMSIQLQSQRARLALIVGGLSLYGLAFFLLYPYFGSSSAALAVLPVVFIGWLEGRGPGLLAGLLSLPANTLLLNLAAPGPFQWDILLQTGGGLGSLAVIVLGVFVGHLHDVQAQLLVERKRVERQTRELALLDQVRQAVARELELPQVIQTVVEGIARTFGYTQVSLYLLEGDVLQLQHQVGYPGVIERIPITDGVSGRVVRTALPVLLEDVRSDPDFLGAMEDLTSEVCVPLFDQGRVVGVLNVESAHGVKLTSADLRLTLALGKQIDIALGRARLYAQVRESQQRFESAVRYAAIGMALVAPDGRWLQVNQALCALVGYTEPELLGMTFQDITHPDDLETDLDHVRQVLAGEIQTYQMEKRYLHKRGHAIWILLSVSLVRDGRNQPLYFISQIQDITQRKQAEAALRDSEARYHGLFEDSSVSLWEEDFSAVKQRLDALRQQGVADFRAYLLSHPEVVAECAALVRVTDVNQATLKLYRAGSKSELLQNLDRVFVDESYDAFQQELAAIAEGRIEFEWEGVNQTLAGERIVVNLHWSAVRGYEDSLAKVIVSLIDVTERKRAEAQLRHSALHDALTGLPNRALFLDHLRHVLERRRRHPDYNFAVLFLDFDRFKVVNDSLGHLIGDQLLVAGAQRLTACVRALDTVARLGGDEFVILLEEPQSTSAVLRVADRIQSELQKAFLLSGHQVFIAASIGIVLSAQASDLPEEILRDADAAMYRAKALGKARYEVFQVDMRAQAVARLTLEAELRQALEQQEFRVYYQPIVAFATGQITGVEALLRWQHPGRGLLLPAAFLTLAEETGLLAPLGRWLLREGCRQLRAWQDQFRREPPLTLNVNLSSQQFMQPDLDQFIQEVLDEFGLAPGSLRLEITERTIIDDTQATAGILARLRALGVQLEIDDFGTGYSALSYLQQLKLDAIKIDRSFVSRLGSEGTNSAVVRTILALGHNLGLRIIAEGVETEAQFAKLKALGCQTGQGFLFGKPVSEGDLARLLRAAGQRDRA